MWGALRATSSSTHHRVISPGLSGWHGVMRAKAVRSTPEGKSEAASAFPPKDSLVSTVLRASDEHLTEGEGT